MESRDAGLGGYGVSTLTKKGQGTVPKDVRDALGLRPGMRVMFEMREGEVVLRKQMDPQDVDRWRGYYRSATRATMHPPKPAPVRRAPSAPCSIARPTRRSSSGVDTS